MVRAHPLIVMSRKNNTERFPAFFLKSPDFIDHGRRNLKIDIVQMHDIRFKILQYFPDFFSRLDRIYDFKRIQELCQSPCVEIHIGSVTFHAVSHDSISGCARTI